VRGLTKVYESYPAASAEASGLFLWLANLRRALQLTTERPRRVVALDGIDLDVAPGEVLGLMGHNGAVTRSDRLPRRRVRRSRRRRCRGSVDARGSPGAGGAAAR
jgi:hypothetical protein